MLYPSLTLAPRTRTVLVDLYSGIGAKGSDVVSLEVIVDAGTTKVGRSDADCRRGVQGRAREVFHGE